MKSALWFTIGKKDARWLITAAFLFVMCFELGSHAMNDLRGSKPASSLTWCEVMHYTSPAIDCPHKRQPFGPQEAVSDQASHHLALIPSIVVPTSGMIYASNSTYLVVNSPISRSLDPPFHPPKQT